MKKFYYSLFAAASMMLAVTSCSQEEDFAQSSSEMTTFSISLDGAVGSRATGDGTTATKLYYQAYRGEELVIDKETTIEKTAKIEMALLKGETYDIIFWAQAAEGTIYQIDDLRNITIDYATAAPKANQESYDAFYNSLNDFTSDAKTHTIELRRPFAKLNLGTSDWNIVETDAATNQNEPNPVTHSSVIVKGLANTFNTLTGEASGDEDVTFALSEIPTDFFTLNEVVYKRLSLNYLLVPNKKAPQGLGEYQVESEEGKANVDLTFALNRGDKELFTIDVPNAPVQRNWRTNVVGELLTGSKFDVIIKPETDDAYNTLEILEEVLTKGGEVTLFSNAVLAEDITIPEGVTVKINLNEKTLKIAQQAKVKGNLIFDGGNLEVATEDPNNELAVGIYAFDGSTVDFKDTKVAVADNNVGVCLRTDAVTTINLEGTEITVGQNGHGISMPFGAKDVDINIKESSIKGGSYGIYMYATDCNVVIDEESSVENFQICGGDATITYAGEKPEVAGDGILGTITYIKMGTTDYEGIYTVDGSNKEYNITSAEGVLNLHKLMADISTGEGQGATINLTTDIDLKNEPFTPIEKMWVTFNGNGHTIKNLYVQSTWRAGLFGYLGGGSINDLTIENANVTGAQAGIFAGSGSGKINNCYLMGNNTVTWAENHLYNDPTKNKEEWNGIGAITGVLSESNITINAAIVAGTTVTLNKTGFTTNEGCKYIDDLTGYINANNGIVTNNGTVTSVVNVSNDTELQTAITNAWQMGKVTIVMADGTYSNDITFIAPTNYTQSDDLVFKAAEGANVIYAGTIQLGLYEKGTTNVKQWTADITFEGITFDHSTDNNHSLNVQNMGVLTLKNCKIIGNGEFGIGSASGNSSGNNSLFYQCEFENMGAQILGQFGNGLTFDDCTFKESKVNVQGGVQVTVKNSRFTNTLTNANINESFYLVRSNSTPITVKECTINIDSELTSVATDQEKWYILANRGTTNWTVENVALTMTEAALKQTELKVTACTSTGVINHTNLTVNGKEYIAEGVLKSEGVYFISSVDGLNYSNEKLFSNGGSYKLTQSIDMANVAWTSKVPQTKHFTFDGGNNTISNWETTSGALLVPQSNYNIEIKNLKLTKCSVNTTSDYAALLIGYADSNKKVEISGIEVNQSEVFGNDYCAALLGWSSKNANISGCSVKKSKFVGGGSTGAYAGHVVADAKGVVTISDAVVEDCEITTNDNNKSKAGIVLGTANVGTTSITTSSLTGNKVNGVENNTNVYGRAVLLTTGKLTVNGEAKQ